MTLRTDVRPRATHRAANRVVDILELVARSRDGEVKRTARAISALLGHRPHEEKT